MRLVQLGGRTALARAQVDVDLKDFHKDELGPFDVHLGVGVEPDRTKLELDAAVHGVKVVHIGGGIDRPGTGLLAALGDKTPGKSTVDKLGNPAIDVKVTVPEHAPKTWAFLKPALEKLPGSFGGENVRFVHEIAPSDVDGAPTLTIRYDHPDHKNPWPVRNIKDELRTIADGLAIGPALFSARAGTERRVLLWFGLTREE